MSGIWSFVARDSPSRTSRSTQFTTPFEPT